MSNVIPITRCIYCQAGWPTFISNGRRLHSVDFGTQACRDPEGVGVTRPRGQKSEDDPYRFRAIVAVLMQLVRPSVPTRVAEKRLRQALFNAHRKGIISCLDVVRDAISEGHADGDEIYAALSNHLHAEEAKGGSSLEHDGEPGGS